MISEEGNGIDIDDTTLERPEMQGNTSWWIEDMHANFDRLAIQTIFMFVNMTYAC